MSSSESPDATSCKWLIPAFLLIHWRKTRKQAWYCNVWLKWLASQPRALLLRHCDKHSSNKASSLEAHILFFHLLSIICILTERSHMQSMPQENLDTVQHSKLKVGLKKKNKKISSSVGVNQHSFNDFFETDYSLITKKII